MMSEQERRDLELRCRKSGLNCDYLIRVKTEEAFDRFLTFRAHKSIHRLGKKR